MLFIWLTCLRNSSCYIFFRITKEKLGQKFSLGDVETVPNIHFSYDLFHMIFSYDLLRRELGQNFLLYFPNLREQLNITPDIHFSYDLFMGGKWDNFV